MARYGGQYGPDLTFLGVDPCDLDDPTSYAGADVVILGAPFDGGTSYRSGARFGPQAIRMTDYLPHDGSRPSLALRTDGLLDLRVVDAGDVMMFSGDAARACASLEAEVEKVARSGAIPLVLGGDHTVTWPDVTGVARAVGWGRVAVLHFDAHADTGNIEFGSLIGHGQPMRRLIESGAARGDRFLQIGLRGYWPPPDTLDWMAQQGMRSYEMTEIGAAGPGRLPHRGVRHRHRRVRRRVPLGGHRRVRPGARPRHRHPRARRDLGPAAAGRRPPDRLRAARRGHGRRRGVPAVRPRGHHGGAGQPGGPRGPVGAGPPPPGRRPRAPPGTRPGRCSPTGTEFGHRPTGSRAAPRCVQAA